MKISFQLVQFFKTFHSSSTIKNGVLFSFFSFLNSGINFFLLIVLAGFLSINGYGKLNLFNTCITLITPLISFSTLGYIGVAYFRKSTPEFVNVIKSVCYISVVVFLFFCVISFCFKADWESWTGLSFEYILYAILICFVQIFTLINLEIWRIKEKVVSYGIYSLLVSGLNCCLTLLLVTQYHYGWLGRVYALIFGVGVFGFFSFYILWKKRYLNFQSVIQNVVTETLTFGIPLIPHQLSFWLRQGLDRFIINYYFTSEVVGIFSFANNFANIIMILGTAFNATNSVFIYKSISSGEEVMRLRLRAQTKFMVSFFAIIVLLVVAGAYFFSPLIFPQYITSIKYILPLCLAAFFHCIYLLFVNYLFYFKKTKRLMNITLACSIVHMCLSLAFTRYDVLITSYISLVSNFLICIAVILYSHKVYPIFYK